MAAHALALLRNSGTVGDARQTSSIDQRIPSRTDYALRTLLEQAGVDVLADAVGVGVEESHTALAA